MSKRPPALGSVDYAYLCEVVRWLDADTAEFVVNLGFGMHVNKKMRLYGINTPEIHSTDATEKKKAIAARDFAAALAPDGSKVRARTVKPAEKFGRWLASVTLQDGTDLATRLIEAGHGVAYFGGKR